MIDMLQNAKDLIAKGKTLNDPELIQMGMDLLDQYSPKQMTPVVNHDTPVKEPEPQKPEYVCQNCGHTMPVDKEGRKRCPECKKHKLVLEQPVISKKQYQPTTEELIAAFDNQQLQPAPTGKIDIEQFHMQVRGTDGKAGRIHYDENGNPDGVIRKREEVDPSMIHNCWNDDGEEAKDEANELLKKFTKISPRTRAPAKMVEVICDNCHKTEKLHPIHAGARGRHICAKCIKRKSGH